MTKSEVSGQEEPLTDGSIAPFMLYAPRIIFSSSGRAYFADDYAIDPQPLAKNILKHPELREWVPRLAEPESP